MADSREAHSATELVEKYVQLLEKNEAEIRSLRSALAKCREEAVAECAKQIPISWLDPLLSGKNSALPATPGEWNCHDIDRLLSAIRARISGLEPRVKSA